MKRIFSVMLAMMMLVTCWAIPATADAATNYKVSLYGTYNQTEGRKVLALVNSMRTSSTDAWYWNKDGTKHKCKNLSALKYDYALEKIAIQRAAEIALYYSHTRPNNTSWSDIYEKGEIGEEYNWMVIGENIACGTGNLMNTAKQVNDAWREDDEDYAGQGHRRNMLSSKFKAMAIGHVVYNGCHYWVELFSDTVNSSKSTTANNSSTKKTVRLYSGFITGKTILSQSVANVEAVEKRTLPSAKMKITTSGGWNRDMTVYATPTSASSYNTSIAKIEGSYLRGVAKGNTNIGVKALGTTVKIPVTVTKNHSYKKTVIAPTYVARGYTKFTCTKCGKIYKDYYTAKKKLPVPGSVSLAAKTKALRVTYNKVSAASGYQIKYSRYSSFSSYKTVKVSGASSVSKTIGSLTSGKRYYVKVRAYKVQNGKTAYSSWSGYKSVVVK